MTELETPVSTDRRVQRTRKALTLAFNRLVLERGYDALSPADVAAMANVGRSTFYEHYSGLDDLLRQTLGRLLVTLATESLKPEPDPKMAWVIQHFWDQRKMARALLGGGDRSVVSRLYAEIFESALDEHASISPRFPVRLIAAQLAAGQLALLAAWLSGQGSATADEVTSTLNGTARAVVTAVTNDPTSP